MITTISLVGFGVDKRVRTGTPRIERGQIGAIGSVDDSTCTIPSIGMCLHCCEAIVAGIIGEKVDRRYCGDDDVMVDIQDEDNVRKV